MIRPTTLPSPQGDPLMDQALALAAQARLICPPNPAVGALLLSPDGRVIGCGHTQVRGGPHAEVMALRDAQARGESTQGATAYVTLEPCSHQGRTGPCCDALIAAGVGRVVASLQDPNPLVAGQGFARLRAAGVDVQVGPGAEAALELNIGFFSRMIRGRPWVRSKIAGSLDGRTALDDGRSQWITSPQARADGQQWRARAGAVLTGVGTVLADDPLLNVRDPNGSAAARQPLLVILDSQMRTPPTARLFGLDRPCLLVTSVADAARHAPYLARQAEVLVLPGLDGRIDLAALMAELGRREINELHVEAGPILNAALQQAGLIDEWLFYLAPKLLGPGRPLLALPALNHLDEACTLVFTDIERVGPDLRLLARLAGAPFPPQPSDRTS